MTRTKSDLVLFVYFRVFESLVLYYALEFTVNHSCNRTIPSYDKILIINFYNHKLIYSSNSDVFISNLVISGWGMYFFSEHRGLTGKNGELRRVDDTNLVLGTHPFSSKFVITCFIISELPIFDVYFVLGGGDVSLSWSMMVWAWLLQAGSTKVRTVGVRTIRPVRKFSKLLVFGLFGVRVVRSK